MSPPVTLDVLDQRLKDMADDLREIKTQTTRTNGRVTALETAQAVSVALATRRNRLFGLLPEWVGPVVAVSLGWLLAHYVS